MWHFHQLPGVRLPCNERYKGGKKEQARADDCSDGSAFIDEVRLLRIIDGYWSEYPGKLPNADSTSTYHDSNNAWNRLTRLQPPQPVRQDSYAVWRCDQAVLKTQRFYRRRHQRLLLKLSVNVDRIFSIVSSRVPDENDGKWTTGALSCRLLPKGSMFDSVFTVSMLVGSYRSVEACI